jgi:hypothetical protein
VCPAYRLIGSEFCFNVELATPIGIFNFSDPIDRSSLQNCDILEFHPKQSATPGHTLLIA